MQQDQALSLCPQPWRPEVRGDRTGLPWGVCLESCQGQGLGVGEGFPQPSSDSWSSGEWALTIPTCARRLYLSFKSIYLLFRAAPAAYGSSHRGPIGAAAAGLHHSHSHAGSHDPLSKARDGTCVFMDTSRVHNPLSRQRNSHVSRYFCPFLTFKRHSPLSPH